MSRLDFEPNWDDGHNHAPLNPFLEFLKAAFIVFAVPAVVVALMFLLRGL